MISILIALALAVSIGIGYKTKINTGLLAICFAYIIGTFVMGLEPDEVISLWPVTIFFDIFAVTLFFSVAVENGTLEKISQHFLFRSRRLTWAVALVFLFTAVVVAALGAGFYAVMVFLCPAALLMCYEMHIEPLLGGLAVVVGAQSGANFMTSLNGIIYHGLFHQLGYSDSQSFLFRTAIFVAYLVLVVLVVTGLTLHYRRVAIRQGAETGASHISAPEPFDAKQKGTLWLIGLFLLLALVPSISHVLAPNIAWISLLNSKMSVVLISVVLAVAAMFLGLANHKRVLEKIPWNILVMISGVGMLVQVAVKAGTIKQIASWLGSGSLPTFFIPIMLAIVAAIITSFGSFIGITAPALYPIVPSIAHLTGLSPTLLFVTITISGLSMGISPYSSAGAMVLGFAPEEERDALFSKELKVALPAMGGTALAATILLTLIMH